MEILKAVVGSRAYNLATAESDTDYFSIHVVPTRQILSVVRKGVETYVQKVDGDDSTSHEIGKFCSLALQGNPTVNEVLWLDEYVHTSRSALDLIDLRHCFLSRNTVTAYFGFITAQIQRSARENFLGALKPKPLRHAARLSLQLDTLLKHGIIRPRLSDHERSWVMGASVPDIEDLVESLKTQPQPQNDPDYNTVNEFLVDLRIRELVNSRI